MLPPRGPRLQRLFPPPKAKVCGYLTGKCVLFYINFLTTSNSCLTTSQHQQWGATVWQQPSEFSTSAAKSTISFTSRLVSDKNLINSESKCYLGSKICEKYYQKTLQSDTQNINVFTIHILSSIPNLKDHKVHNKSDRCPRPAKFYRSILNGIQYKIYKYSLIGHHRVSHHACGIVVVA